MSNPGVITLTEKRIGARSPFRVEDNLGEAIHIHYNDIRIDLTIRELLQLSDVCDRTIYDLIDVKSFDLDEFDTCFLLEYAKNLLDLIEVRHEYISVNGLRVLERNKVGLPITRPFDLNKRKSTSENEYLPVVFNDEKILVYCGGCRCANDNTIEIIRLRFENNKYSITSNPWIPFLFKWNKWRLKEVAYKVAKKIF